MTKRMKTRDVAFQFRMGAGFPGDVNRTHPVSIEPVLINTTNPPLLYGNAVILDTTTQSVRKFIAGDQSNTVAAGYGLVVRPFPIQQEAATNFGTAAIGVGVPPVTGICDVVRSGYIMSLLNAGSASPLKGQPVYVWAVATSGNHIQGGLESVYSAGNTTQLLNAIFNGSADASGNVEIAFNI